MQKFEVLVADIREWLGGKKTYLLAALLVATVLVLVFLGRLTPETALSVALVFAGLLSASFRSAIEQHHAEMLNLLIGISEAGIDLRAGNKAGALAALEPVVSEAFASDGFASGGTVPDSPVSNVTHIHFGGTAPAPEAIAEWLKKGGATAIRIAEQASARIPPAAPTAGQQTGAAD